MRYDSQGLFWHDKPPEKKERGAPRERIKPPIPDDMLWCPDAFPNLSAAKTISVDVETWDPDLKEKGPGAHRGSYLVGIAVGTEDRQWYFPMEHENQYDPNGVNLPREAVLEWARDNLCGPQTKLFANAMYDLEFLWCADVQVPGPYIDVQVAAPLIDENAGSYALGKLADLYGLEGKDESRLYEWLARAYGGQATRRAQGGRIALAPPEMVAQYAMSDVRLPFEVYERQKKELARDDLEEIFDVESRLIPLLLAMRLRGVAVDVKEANELDDKLVSKAAEYREQLAEQGITDPWSADNLASWCDTNDIAYRTTPKGAPSFRGPWLENHQHDTMQLVHQVRRLEKHAGTFIQGTVLSNEVNGRIHTQFHQLRGDEYGTVSGRFSSSHPNLQNIPSRDDELGPLIRGLFIPDEGHEWRSDDWSQIEFRLLVHYGGGETAARTREAYRRDNSTDFHQWVAELTGIDRKPAKNINFGLVYGMGEVTMANNMGRDINEVRPMFDQYHSELPFVRSIYKKVQDAANKRGYICTILGRRRRWELYESTDWKTGRKDGSMSHAEALEKYGSEFRIRRAYTHKALNALLQGGAADIMKKAMVDIWESGICDVLGAPLLTVHDELNWSVPLHCQAANEAHLEAVRLMEVTCNDRLRLPLRVDSTRGKNWGLAA